MTIFLRFFILLFAISLAGCGATLPKLKPYKMDIQQGNVVTSEMLLKLRPGMSKSQVKFIMGTPLLVDSFRTNRWDYFYQLRKQGKVVAQRRVILDFESDLLKRVRGDVVAKGKTVEDVTKQLEEEVGVVPNANEGGDVGSLALVVTPLETPTIESAKRSLEAKNNALPASVLVLPAVVDAVEAGPAKGVEEELTLKVLPSPKIAKETNLTPAQMPVKPALTESKAKGVAQTLTPLAAPVAKRSPGEEKAKEILIVMPSKANSSKNLFRLDYSLDTTRIISREVIESKAALPESIVKETKEEGKLPEEDDPSFFERALEKIGF